MANAPRELTAGSVELYQDRTLGVGAYGKVCRAKCGQLPCAAKLLHDTLFQYDESGTQNLTRRFELECQFLSTIKHPNIVQYLGTTRDPQYGRPVLLMELMDGSLTKFLEQQSIGPLSYHIQINICHDVALALSYLHSNAIVHRDLSSNNVLLIGEGNRAKVTDFGMSKLIDANPRMTPLTQCPGTSAYMPPEALSMPSQYSSKLDCFSYGVLTVQVVTRKFPNPGDASQYVEDPNYPTGRVLVQFPEKDRRKADIDLVYPQHPLRSIALHCLADREKERPSADELCGRLALLKREGRYAHSVELTADQSSASRQLTQEIERNREGFEREKERLVGIIRQNREELQRAKDDLQRSQIETERSRKELEKEREKNKKDSQDNEAVLQQVFEDYSKQLKELQWKLDCSEQNRRSEEQEKLSVQRELAAVVDGKSRSLDAGMLSATNESQRQSAPNSYNYPNQPSASSYPPPNTTSQPSIGRSHLPSIYPPPQTSNTSNGRSHPYSSPSSYPPPQTLNTSNGRSHPHSSPSGYPPPQQPNPTSQPSNARSHPYPSCPNSYPPPQPPNPSIQPSTARSQPPNARDPPPQEMPNFQDSENSYTPINITWKEGEKAPQAMRSIYGAAVEFHGNAYFSSSDTGNIFSYSPFDKKWSKLPNVRYFSFSLAVVNDKLTTVGGTTDLYDADASTNVLLSYSSAGFGIFTKQWKEFVPPMPTKRMSAATATTNNYLVVAGGEKGIKEKVVEVEVMKTDILQWFRASNLPQPLHYPQMAICSEHCYICAENVVFSCSVDTLIKTAHIVSNKNPSPSAWNKRANVPIHSAPGLATVKGQLLSIGGKDHNDAPTTGAIYRFDPQNNSWNFVGRMPTPRSHVLAVTLPSDVIVVVGGIYGTTSITTEVGQLRYC